MALCRNTEYLLLGHVHGRVHEQQCARTSLRLGADVNDSHAPEYADSSVCIP